MKRLIKTGTALKSDLNIMPLSQLDGWIRHNIRNGATHFIPYFTAENNDFELIAYKEVEQNQEFLEVKTSKNSPE